MQTTDILYGQNIGFMKSPKVRRYCDEFVF